MQIFFFIFGRKNNLTKNITTFGGQKETDLWNISTPTKYTITRQTAWASPITQTTSASWKRHA